MKVRQVAFAFASLCSVICILALSIFSNGLYLIPIGVFGFIVGWLHQTMTAKGELHDNEE